MSRLRCYRRPRLAVIGKYGLICALVLTSTVHVLCKIKLLLDYRRAQVFYLSHDDRTCPSTGNRTHLILFWTKIFSDPIDEVLLNSFLSTDRCGQHRCQVTRNRDRLCQSDAVIFHARGGLNVHDMPEVRSAHQRYVLLIKEPPHMTTAIVGHFNYVFNWTATYRRDSDIDYRYFHWRRKAPVEKSSSHLNNRSARAASMVSNCRSQSNREAYLDRLDAVVPVTRIGFCSSNKCRQSRASCLDTLADTHPFYLAFENALCRDYATEKYANVILNSRMIPIVFSRDSDLYIPHSFIDANDFPSPELLGHYLRYLVSNATAYESYFRWQRDYELFVPDENEYLCQLCQKLNDSQEPTKIYASMKQWLYADAKCQRWVSASNRRIDIPVDETMIYEDPWY